MLAIEMSPSGVALSATQSRTGERPAVRLGTTFGTPKAALQRKPSLVAFRPAPLHMYWRPPASPRTPAHKGRDPPGGLARRALAPGESATAHLTLRPVSFGRFLRGVGRRAQGCQGEGVARRDTTPPPSSPTRRDPGSGRHPARGVPGRSSTKQRIRPCKARHRRPERHVRSFPAPPFATCPPCLHGV